LLDRVRDINTSKVDRFQPKAVIFEPEYKELGPLELVAVLHM